MRNPRSLLTRANYLLLMVGLLAAGLGVGAAWLAWRGATNAYAQRTNEQTLSHYQAKLSDFARENEKAAARHKAQIEFLRIGELSGEQRLARLRAFFTAQAEYRYFEGVMLVNADGVSLYSAGCQAMLLDSLNLNDLYVKSHCADAGTVYAISRTPIWLGAEERGTALFARALNNGLLTHLARGMDTLFLLQGGRTVASSLGEQGLRVPFPANRNGRDGDTLWVSLPLAGENAQAGGGNAPLLVIQRPLDSLVSPRDVMVAAALLTLLLLVLLWFGLGRAVRGHLKEIESLSRSAGAFLVQFRRSPRVREVLEKLTTRQDEMGQLGTALDQLMEETESRYAEQAAYLQTLDMLEEAVLELDLAGRITQVSSGWRKVTGIDADAAGQMLADYLDPEDAPALVALVAALARHEKQQISARLRLARQGEGEGERWLELRLLRAGGHDCGGDCLRGVLRDITQGYLQERRITHMALHDALTGLPNRVLLEDRMKIAMRMAERNRHKVALGFIDIDHFKHVNDSMGHKMGDQLLIALADRLRRHLRSGDTLARWGGDEFIVLLPDMATIEAIREVAEKLRLATETPLTMEEGEFHLTISAGYAVFPDDAENGELLQAHADRAMFYAKAQGRNNLQFFADMAHKGLGKKEVYIQQRLAAAIREKRISNHYQPLVDAKTGRVEGVETLARWYEPDSDGNGGWISPATFIPMAENLGLIRELGEQVWYQALQDMQGWRECGFGDFGLSVNLSKRQLFMPFFTEKLLEDTQVHGLEPGRVTLEITESIALLDVEYAAERLKELREAGFRLSIDDFGTGYSSLSQLHDLPVHELKIDIAFVRRIVQPQGARLVQTIVGMADALGLSTVAEGVEDAAVAERLREMGVDILQGWHLGRPMSAEALTAWLAARAHGDWPEAAR
ncbi:MAG: EAL domain-containing protein [Pseudomonadota bacterium]|nr:EAL domain-containing protein [Pseudomonadota bacterium]MDP1904536.1 EAL domain-containing protein [Pseudomonadota bacterium]MDP2353942.1 EAL domain-containing protein [Pseudomonadota bacterium]